MSYVKASHLHCSLDTVSPVGSSQNAMMVSRGAARVL